MYPKYHCKYFDLDFGLQKTCSVKYFEWSSGLEKYYTSSGY